MNRSLCIAVITSLLLVLPGCQSTRLAGDSVASPRDPRASGIVIVRSYDDVFKQDGAEIPVHVEYAWDYDRAVAIQRIRDAQGRISEHEQPMLTLNLTDAEKAYAFELARADPQIGPQMQAADHVYGGFSYRVPDDADCNSRSRCVHVIASAGDGWRKLVHAIVDLQTGRVVQPHFAAGDVDPYTAAQLKAHRGKTP
ncbi:MAG: hypothetical protein IT479_07700 [Xanthomonadales bacterium]|nr:hypothetical protein [Xanthomonadales bacterium]MCC6593143.1 hypothetical protein [Xanthomonadales bacterium]MCE7931299.1 hypothetical protein [Xanthomonadales bacterium PRO6]